MSLVEARVRLLAIQAATAGALATIPVAALAGTAAAVDPGPGVGVNGSGVFVPRPEPVVDPGPGIGVPGPGVFVPRTGSADLGAPRLGLLPALGWGLPGLPGHLFLR